MAGAQLLLDEPNPFVSLLTHQTGPAGGKERASAIHARNAHTFVFCGTSHADIAGRCDALCQQAAKWRADHALTSRRRSPQG